MKQAPKDKAKKAYEESVARGDTPMQMASGLLSTFLMDNPYYPPDPGQAFNQAVGLGDKMGYFFSRREPIHLQLAANEPAGVPGMRTPDEVAALAELDAMLGYGPEDYKREASNRKIFEASGQYGPPTPAESLALALQQLAHYAQARDKYINTSSASDKNRNSSK